LKVITKDPTSS